MDVKISNVRVGQDEIIEATYKYDVLVEGLRKLVEEMGADVDIAENAGAVEVALALAYWKIKFDALIGGQDGI